MRLNGEHHMGPGALAHRNMLRTDLLVTGELSGRYRQRRSHAAGGLSRAVEVSRTAPELAGRRLAARAPQPHLGCWSRRSLGSAGDSVRKPCDLAARDVVVGPRDCELPAV